MIRSNIDVKFAEKVSTQIKNLKSTIIFILERNPSSANFVPLVLRAEERMLCIKEVILAIIGVIQRNEPFIDQFFEKSLDKVLSLL